jgi:hypothetical protein
MSATSKRKKQDNLLGSKPEKKRQGKLVRSYEWFLELPIPIVLTAMWLAGVGLISVGMLALPLLVGAGGASGRLSYQEGYLSAAQFREAARSQWSRL